MEVLVGKIPVNLGEITIRGNRPPTHTPPPWFANPPSPVPYTTPPYTENASLRFCRKSAPLRPSRRSRSTTACTCTWPRPLPTRTRLAWTTSPRGHLCSPCLSPAQPTRGTSSARLSCFARRGLFFVLRVVSLLFV